MADGVGSIAGVSGDIDGDMMLMGVKVVSMVVRMVDGVGVLMGCGEGG